MTLRRSRCTALCTALLGSLAFAPIAQAQGEDAPADDEEKSDEGPEADSAAVFSLDAMIEVAVRKAPDLSRSKLDRTAAEATAKGARADQQWVLEMGAQYKSDAVSNTTIVPLFQPVSTDVISAMLGLGRKLPTNGEVKFELGINQTKVEQNIPDMISEQLMLSGQNLDEFYTQVQTTARLTFKQPIVRGFGPAVALASQAKADYQFILQTAQSQSAAEELIRDVVTAYWELAYATYEIDTRNESLQLAKQQEKIMRAERAVGKGSENSVNTVLYEIQVRQEALLQAQLDAEKKSLDLRRKVGLQLDKRNILLRPSEKFEIGDAEWDVDETLNRSHAANRKLANVAIQKRIADVDVTVAKSGILPQVDLNLSGAAKGTEPDVGTSISSAASVSGYEITAGIQVSFELSGAAKANYNAALARRRRLDVDREDLQRQLDAEVVNSVKAVTFAKTRAILSTEAIRIAELNVRQEVQGYQVGKNTNYTVMQRQTELIDAKLRQGRAVADYYVAIATLQFLSGTILEQYGINVRPKAAQGGGRGSANLSRD